MDEQSALSGVRPFRAPHHSASVAGLVGGGAPPRAGEASLAHNGVLFLDEMPEFAPSALQCLRQPLEDGTVTLVRAEGRISFPARFTLVGAANPCPCGFFGDPDRQCRCPPAVIERYANRIGGPLMDRIDLHVEVPRPDPSQLLDMSHSTVCSRDLRDLVMSARAFAAIREHRATAMLAGSELLAACDLETNGARFVEHAARVHHLSGRALTRLLRVARTIADIDRNTRVGVEHIAEALSYRTRGAAQ